MQFSNGLAHNTNILDAAAVILDSFTTDAAKLYKELSCQMSLFDVASSYRTFHHPRTK